MNSEEWFLLSLNLRPSFDMELSFLVEQLLIYSFGRHLKNFTHGLSPVSYSFGSSMVKADPHHDVTLDQLFSYLVSSRGSSLDSSGRQPWTDLVGEFTRTVLMLWSQRKVAVDGHRVIASCWRSKHLGQRQRRLLHVKI